LGIKLSKNIMGKIRTILWLGMVAVSLGIAGELRANGLWGRNYFPDVTLTNHHGETRKFFTDLIEGKTVVVNFIYTSCPDACPLETSRLREVYALLSPRVGQDIHFYSISIDPEVDTVEVLNRYAKKWEVGSGWEFLTGSEEEVNDLRAKLGMAPDTQALEDHQVNMVIGNQATGRWMHRSPFDTPQVLAEHIGSWLSNYKYRVPQERDYSEAPELRRLSAGEYIFRTRCASCHSVGNKAGASGLGNPLGPDLTFIQARRSKEWLVRWICEPDQMLQERDPIATALLAQYNNLPMPNLQLTEANAEAVLEYLREESEGKVSSDQEVQHASADRKVKCPNCVKEPAEEAAELPKKWDVER
jgi:protein SCO1/2